MSGDGGCEKFAAARPAKRNSRRAPKWIRMQREREAAAEVWGSEAARAPVRR